MKLTTFLKEKRSRKKKTVGFAFGSGGAKGMAHLGALKAFEEEGISAQAVAGTSIGAIVGALYARGYSATDMIEIVRNLNLREFAGKLRPYADTAFVEEYLSQYLEGEIEELSLPFACCATDAITNEGVLLNKGSVVRAITASSAVPPFFRSVLIGGRRLYDGAFTNAMPADACKKLSVEVVIGCDLFAFAKPDEEKSGIARAIGSAINAFVTVRYLPNSRKRGYEASDFVLRPNLREYRATDVSRRAMERMFEIGYEEARSQMDKIKAIIFA